MPIIKLQYPFFGSSCLAARASRVLANSLRAAAPWELDHRQGLTNLRRLYFDGTQVADAGNRLPALRTTSTAKKHSAPHCVPILSHKQVVELQHAFSFRTERCLEQSNHGDCRSEQATGQPSPWKVRRSDRFMRRINAHRSLPPIRCWTSAWHHFYRSQEVLRSPKADHKRYRSPRATAPVGKLPQWSVGPTFAESPQT